MATGGSPGRPGSIDRVPSKSHFSRRETGRRATLIFRFEAANVELLRRGVGSLVLPTPRPSLG